MAHNANHYNFISVRDYTKIEDDRLYRVLSERYAIRILKLAGSTTSDNLFKNVYGDHWTDVPFKTLLKLAKATKYPGQAERGHYLYDKEYSNSYGCGWKDYNRRVRVVNAQYDGTYVRALGRFFNKKAVNEFMTGLIKYEPTTYKCCTATEYAKDLLTIAFGCKKYYVEGLKRLKKLDVNGISSLHKRYRWYRNYCDSDKRTVHEILGDERAAYVLRNYYKNFFERGEWSDATMNAILWVTSECARSQWTYEMWQHVAKRIAKRYGEVEKLVEGRRMLDEMNLKVDYACTRHGNSRLNSKLYRAIKTTYKAKQPLEAKQRTLITISSVINNTTYTRSLFSPVLGVND